MLYLLFRITVFLVAAAGLGFGVGWYVRQVSSAKREADIQKQLNTARSRVPQLEASLKNREVDCERLRQELTEGENKFTMAGALIDKRDHELVARDRKITWLNNSLDILKAAPAQFEEPGQCSVVPDDYADKETELREQKKLLSQLETRLDIQDQLIREAETRAESKAAELVSLVSNHSRLVDTLEEMLAEAQIKVASLDSSQKEADENIQRLMDENSELRSAESQHESEMTNLDEELAQGRQEKLNLEQSLERGRQIQMGLEQDLKQSMQVQFFMEQDLGRTRETGQQLAELEDDLVKLQSELDSQAELSGQELLTVQVKLADQKETLSVLKKRNTGLEEQLTRSRQAQLKLAVGYNEGMAARKQLEAIHDQGATITALESERVTQLQSLEILGRPLNDARETEVRQVQRHREQQETIETLESAFLPAAGVKPAMLFEELPAHVDNLKKLKGLGVVTEKQLNSLGIYRFQQIAEFDSSNVDWVEKQLKKLKGRFKRDDWIAQATHLLKSAPDTRSSDSALH